MKKMLIVLLLFLCFSVPCSADMYDVQISSCSLTFFDDWNFFEYTGEFEKLSSRDRMFYNALQDVIILSVFSDAHPLPQSTGAELFDSANSLMKAFQADDGSSIVTLGQVDKCPRLTIIDETDSLSTSQWFVFTGSEVIYIFIQSPDKYRVREYNSSLHTLQIQ